MTTIIPGMTELTAPYWAAAREGRLVVQECGECGRLTHPPLPACPDCHARGSAHGGALGWREVSGEGTVYSCTVVRHATHAAFADQVPYVVALVQLAEGPRLVTSIVNCPPESVRAGQPVRVLFRPVTSEVTLPYFEPFSAG